MVAIWNEESINWNIEELPKIEGYDNN
jgi:hypothetical protein